MTDIKNEEVSEKKSLNFIEQALENDLKEGKNGGRVQTRFPPEPNGYLHIGHAKAICLDFGMATKYGGTCNLRFDDTNPIKEDMEYVEAIKEDIQWLGFQWDNICYASDYFQQLWDFAVALIKQGKAYIDEQSAEEIARQKGTPTQPGVESPYRNRPIEESLALFEQMNSDEAVEGSMVLRAKIDMANPNMHLRDPLMYRIMHVEHHRTGTQWKAYPMYDFAHGQSDYFEGVTHSWCTLEFVVHRPLYDLFIDWLKEGKDLNDNRPRQTEFNKLNLSYTLMSKRNLLILVNEGMVNGWDDPRMPTISAFRRRGYSPESIRKFIDKIGYTTYDALNEFALLESAVREDLNTRATRVSAVINPVRLVITNYPEGQVEALEATDNPEDPNSGSHTIEFSRELWMEREDFMEEAPKKYFRMTPGQEVRLKNAYIVKCTGCTKDEATGEITEIQCEYLPDTKSGMPEANRRVKGTLHWVSCDHCLPAEVRLYDRLWNVENPRDEVAAIREARNCSVEEAMRQIINPDSLKVLTHCFIEKHAATLPTLSYLQFQRIGYFNIDQESTPDKLVFNRTVGLKDGWGKIKNS
ncbi:glutamine--tRNA ligase/YqeY domain fusion protein [Bacteroides sp.]|uniref:glutamine--tRNA ligase/YqeY domain fusion protein n=1 Tax=Bacteroides sp. TaxID=29523 RepID=UPI001B6C70F3|nr:glutamine--tRNA ligase/YqeY domain fusion protein [Bacteroides sp.]MBP6064602.1 glutamine--tRNA ligase/YqeY domain fusion protein [Bacteroides sp.]MBP6066943.1 glutamine--tRNA ligase/YqeY domain fusion protein [Bacteroides sp.]MBP6935827.1 glutamine--tRNA ligase/YqeY domain fusion protein [Bacteroides sp.]MBP8622257.1 glutamine--tRNA ligase/YqeY domain fusion protein [Bacteroides sp.]MBP9585536.1 glutamine--tRNA ligase/YqeY domain fusion protein [Bacteroides sp.]